MNEITISTTVFPVLRGCNFLIANEAFFHVDRTAPFHVLILVTKGTIYVTEENESGKEETDYEIKEGELLFLKSGIRHYGKRPIAKGTSWYYVHFQIEDQTSFPLPAADSTPMPQEELCAFRLPLPKKLSLLSGSSIEKKLHDFITYFHSTAPDRRLRLNAMLYELLCEAALYEQTLTCHASLSDKIALYLEAHANEPFSSAKLEKHFFLSYKHMAAVFKKEKQLTMQQYHTSLRMHTACRLLQTTTLSIGEISAETGYQDMLYFSRCFHAYTGASPSEYRKRLPLLY